jgi:hypothetical protein
MSAAMALGLLWAVAGVVLGLRWWQERDLAGAGRTAAEAPPTTRFGRARDDGSGRRLQAMRLAYAAGTTSVALGMFTGAAALLALGAAMVNLGTIFRYLVVALDLDGVDTPLFVRNPRPVRSQPQHALLAKSG